MLTLHSTAACGFPLYLNNLPHLSYFAMPAAPPQHTHTTMNIKPAELDQQKPLKEQHCHRWLHFTHIQQRADAPGRRFQHGDVLQTGWFLFLLEYIRYAVQLAASRDLHAECAGHIMLKHARWIMSKTGEINQKGKQRSPSPSNQTTGDEETLTWRK